MGNHHEESTPLSVQSIVSGPRSLELRDLLTGIATKASTLSGIATKASTLRENVVCIATKASTLRENVVCIRHIRHGVHPKQGDT